MATKNKKIVKTKKAPHHHRWNYSHYVCSCGAEKECVRGKCTISK